MRESLLRDIEFGHDLDAGYDEGCECTPGVQDVVQHAVHAEAHAETILVRLDVNVGRIFLDGFRQHRIDEADDGRIVVALEQIGRLEFLCNLCQVELVVESAHHFHGLVAALFV